jgi:hypothetical protein
MVQEAILLVRQGVGVTKWQIVLEVQLNGPPDDIDGLLDRVMTDLVDADIEDPAIGLVGADSGLAEIEFVVTGASNIHEAHELAQAILAKTALQLPDGGTLVGESTRQAELVLA